VPAIACIERPHVSRRWSHYEDQIIFTTCLRCRERQAAAASFKLGNESGMSCRSAIRPAVSPPRMQQQTFCNAVSGRLLEHAARQHVDGRFCSGPESSPHGVGEANSDRGPFDRPSGLTHHKIALHSEPDEPDREAEMEVPPAINRQRAVVEIRHDGFQYE
jgi:hypothetical protein